MVRYSSDSASAADVLQDGSSIGTVQSEHAQGRVSVALGNLWKAQWIGFVRNAGPTAMRALRQDTGPDGVLD